MTHGGTRRRGKVALAVIGSVLGVGLVVWYAVIPYPWTLRTRNPERTALMEQRIQEARAAGDRLEIRQEWRPLEAMSPGLVRAVIVAEDYRFRLHEGVDWVSVAEEVRWTGDDSFSWLSPSDLRALRRAVAYAWANRHDLRGRSTLTQQLAKNLYFGTDRTFVRKAMELVVAGRLERRLGKDRILELYLNVVEWGPGTFGAEAAARRYFGRSAASLSLDEAAALAATLPHPLTSNPAYRPNRMLWRKELILQRLDPTSGFPEAPLPLPEPEIEIGIEPGLEIPTGELVPLDTLSASPLDSMALDSMALDSVAAGAAPSDSMNADSTAGATARPDSVPR
jgi:monofunctional biosynthetic peptidoglycan transglycosylase